MDKLEEILDALNKLHGYIEIAQDRESELIAKGRAIGIEDGYKAGYAAGFEEGFKEGKIFPLAETSEK